MSALYDELGPKDLRKVAVITRVASLVMLAVVGVALYKLHSLGQLDAKLWLIFVEEPDIITLLLGGLWNTLQVALIAMGLSITVGALMAAGMLSNNRPIKLFIRSWLEIFRGLPVLLIILFVYLGAPVFGRVASPLWSLILGLTLYNSAVFAEIFRAGVVSLPRGQKDAGFSVGLTEGETLRYILMPQAARRMLPSLVSQTVIVLKETSLGFIIGYTELLREGRTVVEYLGGQIGR